MNSLRQNMINIHGDAGAQWIENLPHILQSLQTTWGLTDLYEGDNLSYHYVAFAMQRHRSVALKIGYDPATILNEYRVLDHYRQTAYVPLIDINKQHHALLLHQAKPGYSLKQIEPSQEHTIAIYSQIIQSISNKRPAQPHLFRDLASWLSGLDLISTTKISAHYIDKAKSLRSTLLSSLNNTYLCHADLHLDNILQDQQTWIAIDPKGVIGELAFEASAWDALIVPNLEGISNPIDLIQQRATLLSTHLHIDPSRLLAWVYLRNLLSFQWFCEDNMHTDAQERLARIELFHQLSNN